MPYLPPSQVVSRRDALRSAAAMAAGAVFLCDWSADAAPAENPAANLADKTSTIRISKLTALPVGTKAYLKLETSHQITGWGEVTGLEPNVACALAQSLYELLDGENPTRIEHLWQSVGKFAGAVGELGEFAVFAPLRMTRCEWSHHRIRMKSGESGLFRAIRMIRGQVVS